MALRIWVLAGTVVLSTACATRQSGSEVPSGQPLASDTSYVSAVLSALPVWWLKTSEAWEEIRVDPRSYQADQYFVAPSPETVLPLRADERRERIGIINRWGFAPTDGLQDSECILVGWDPPPECPGHITVVVGVPRPGPAASPMAEPAGTERAREVRAVRVVAFSTVSRAVMDIVIRPRTRGAGWHVTDVQRFMKTLN